MTHDGDFWAGRTIRWNGDDLAVRDLGDRPSSGGRLLVVGGMMYARRRTPDRLRTRKQRAVRRAKACHGKVQPG
jgi:hypothetical protein